MVHPDAALIVFLKRESQCIIVRHHHVLRMKGQTHFVDSVCFIEVTDGTVTACEPGERPRRQRLQFDGARERSKVRGFGRRVVDEPADVGSNRIGICSLEPSPMALTPRE